MKKITYILTTALMMGGLASCDLDSESLYEKDTSNFPQTADDAAQVLAGIYQNLNAVNAYPQETYHYAALLASDDMLGGGGENDKLMQSLDLLCNYGTNATNDFYNARYEGINRANTVIDALNTVTMDETDKAQAMGEALFLRAYYYYELSSMYGRVPLITTPTAPEDLTPPAASVIWGQILQDLRDASDMMPSVRTSDTRAGHVDKYCAEALLGRCWLYYTGMYCNGEELADLISTNYSPLTSVALPDGSTLTKQDVINYIDDCVNNSGYRLLGDFRNNWAYTNKYTVDDYSYTAGVTGVDGNPLAYAENDNATSPESMFAVKFNKAASWQTTIGYCSGYALHFGIRGQESFASRFPWGEGWGAGPVAPNMISDWKAAEPNDLRRDASVEDCVNTLASYRFGGDTNMQETALHQKKIGVVTAKNSELEVGYSVSFEQIMYPGGWSIAGSENFQLCSIHDMIMIRFAEVLLMQSELKEDATGMNQVRARAGLSAKAYSLDNILNERRWELAFEGMRWMDMRRTHRAAALLEKQTGVTIHNQGNETTNTAQNGGYAARFNATAGFFKIPETQITLSEGTLTQNAGYTGATADYNGWN